MIVNTKLFGATAALALSSLLGGCAVSNVSNRSMDSVHQPVVGQSHYSLDLVTDNGSLSGGEQQRLIDWLGAMRVGYGDRIAIDDSNSYSNTSAHQSVSDVVARHGLLLSAGAPVTEGTAPPGTLRVVMSRTLAEVPGCPNWDSKSTTDFATATSSNYGCAINSNLAAMVADPQDLIQGKSSNSQDPLSAAKAIHTYRSAEPTGKGGLTKNNTQGGN